MSLDVLVTQLKKVGWSDLSPGEFLGVPFERVGKAKVARNNWFVLLKDIPVLDGVGLDTWSDQYERFCKQSQAGMFKSGKYFVLILLAEALAPETAQALSTGLVPGFLEPPELIARGGGYCLLLLKEMRQVLMPKKIVLWDVVRGIDFLQGTHAAVINYVRAAWPGASVSVVQPQVSAEKMER